MRNRHYPTREVGFSLIELIVVVAIIGIAAAVGLPAIASYYRNYQINGGAREVASEIAAARIKAISRNVNQGVTFQIVDNNTYRYVIEDENPDLMGPLYDLPLNVQFQAPAGTTVGGFRFNRLGMICRPGSGVLCPVLPPGCTGTETATRCSDTPGNYIQYDDLLSRYQVTVLHIRTGLTRNVQIAYGGRILVGQ